MPDSSAALPGLPSSASEPEQPAEATAPLFPLGCLRQATTPIPAGAIIPRPTCKAKACPGTCRRKRTQDAT